MSAPTSVVALTGCTRGIGRALFEYFAAAGLKVAGCGTNQECLEALRKAHPTCLLSQVDVRSEQAVASWMQEVSSSFGSIDLLVCNAAVMRPPCTIWETPAEDWATSCEVNVISVGRVLRHAVPHLRSPGAKVVLMTSRYGRTVIPGLGCYSATKWSIEAMAKTLALELRDRGILAVSLDPGMVDTDMFRTSNTGGQDCGQRAPGEFAADAGSFILSLQMEDTGRNLTTPGSPASYFQTGMAYKDRPAWANGFSGFVRVRDEAEAPATKKRRAADPGAQPGCDGPLRYFISGVMLGSRRTLNDSATDMVPQDFRPRIAAAIRRADPEAEIVEPLDVVSARAAAFGMSLGQLSQHTEMVRESFEEVVGLVADCDVIVSNLPEASMGSAVELWEAKKAGRKVLTISPMKDNWLLRSVTHHNFTDLDDFEQNLKGHLPERRPKEP